ncbi:MAG: hypothetical protein SNJ62_03075, partial [Chloracidobacterium sp.]
RLYALNGGSRTVSAYAINPANGTLTPLPFSPIDLPSGFTTAGTVMVHPTGSPLLVGNSNGGIASYNITATSATPAAGSPFATPTGNFSSAFSRDGSFFYTGGNDSSGATSGFSVNAATGVLTPLPGSPFATGSNLVGLSTDANGRLFGIEFFGNSPLRAFTASAGVPTAVTGSPFASGLSQGIKTSVSPNNNVLAVAAAANLVGIYALTGTGAATNLLAVTGSPFASPGGPTTLSYNRNGSLLFVGSSSNRSITSFQADVTTGVLSSPVAQPMNTLGTSGQINGMVYYAPATSSGCLYTVTPTALNVGGEVVASTTLTVATTPDCAWEATVRNTDAPWIKLISAQLPNGQVVTPRMVGQLGDVNRRLAISVTGSATLTIGVGRNPSATPRVGTFFVAGQVVTVTQAGSSGPGAPIGSTMAMFRPSNGYMYLKNRLISDFADNDFFYGLAGDAPLAGDWDGDGIDTPGIYRNVNGVMTFFLINNNTGGFADVSFGFGQPGDVPLAGDWDGNGTVTCGVYRPGAQTFFLRNTNTAGSPDLAVVISGGQANDLPVAGRWTVGSSVTGLGLYRPSTGQFLLKNANVSGAPDATFAVTTSGTVVGPVAGDWLRQGFAAVGVVVNLGGTIQFQLRTTNTSGAPEIRVNYGVPGDVPLIGNWDGQPKPPPVSVP